MSRFTQSEEPLGRFVGDETYRLEEDMEYWLGGDETGVIIVVPKGFETDFASIPRFFQRLLPKLDKHRRAAILHDFLYARHGLNIYSRDVCDGIFLEAMKILEVPKWKRFTMYQAVRRFGWLAWRGHEKRLKREWDAANL
jgi:hypothetical protein